jgi:uncharacterized protein (TIRG00374 family)
MQRYRNQILIGLALTLVVYIGFFLLLDNTSQFGSAGVADELARFPWALLILCALTQVSAGCFRFAAWTYYLGVIGARDRIRLKDSLIIFVSGFVMVVSPGKAAELLKAVFLKVRTGIPVTRSAPIIIAERVIDGLAVMVIMVLTLLFAGSRLDLGDFNDETRAVIYTSSVLLAAGLIGVQIRPLAYFGLRILGALPLIRRLQQPLTEFYESSREIFLLRHVIPMTLVGLGVYMSTSVGFYIVLAGFGLDLTPTLFLQATFIMGVVSAIGALSFVPNGAGISEISTAVLLTAIVAPGMPELTPAVAATAALIQGFFHKWFRVVVGLIVAVIYRERLFPPEFEVVLREARAEMAANHPQAARPAITTEGS